MSAVITTDCQKSRIAQQFSRAAKSYDSAAKVQLDIATDALDLVIGSTGTLLDIGCGTGRNSPALANKCERLIALDLAFGMLSYAQSNSAVDGHNTSWLQGDAEHLPIQNYSVDRLFSSMVLQWCGDQHKVMSEVNRVLTNGGQAVLAIMCDGSFSQLNQSWLHLDKNKHVNDFAKAQVWQQAGLAQGLKVKVSKKQYVTWHADLRQLLSSIKAIGANVVLPKQEGSGLKRFNRHTLQNLETVYHELFAENGQLPLTYQVCYLQCIKN
ncbi:methyltransferase domain-containing protein [Paraglaciecola aquimarina]|uniref:Methyltransferase domain-containing protein n=1 Tax=Paraglaciecola algarum TaxID=3050085 RepID=A0ABS9D9V8_9ALTE|nr:methyltransferase domain-containing protein [Paraglaciecola sp. G1-23]MCF2949756.1 methyltransferase domain-containing protein [Paraglaciecola sp. G1-23]